MSLCIVISITPDIWRGKQHTQQVKPHTGNTQRENDRTSEKGKPESHPNTWPNTRSDKTYGLAPASLLLPLAGHFALAVHAALGGELRGRRGRLGLSWLHLRHLGLVQDGSDDGELSGLHRVLLGWGFWLGARCLELGTTQHQRRKYHMG